MEKTELTERFLQVGRDLGWWRRGTAFEYYCRRQLFEGVPVEGRRILDVGCGNGCYSVWSAVEGASEVVGLEPSVAGSRGNVEVQRGRSAIDSLGLRNVRIEEETLEVFDGCHGRWDILLLHATVNHLDEDACVSLHESPEAWAKYLTIARHIRSLCEPGGSLIITDVARRNLFGDLGWRNPFAPTIEWHKHQQPELWARLFVEAGFRDPRIQWVSNSVWGPLGCVQRNRCCAYLRNSYFRLVLRAA